MSTRSLRQLFIAFNTLQPGPQQNKLVRQAINYAVDVPAIVKNVLGGRGYEITTPIPPNYFGYDASVPGYKHDLAKAKALLAKAGYPDGKGISLDGQRADRPLQPRPRGRRSRSPARCKPSASRRREAAGVGVVLEPGRTGARSRRSTSWAGTSRRPTPTASITALFTSTAPLSCYSNPEIDKLADQARGELDFGQAQGALQADRDDPARGCAVDRDVPVRGPLRDLEAAALAAARRRVHPRLRDVRRRSVIAYLARRALGALWALIGVAIVVFVILHLTGDPASVMMPPEATARRDRRVPPRAGLRPAADRPVRVVRARGGARRSRPLAAASGAGDAARARTAPGDGRCSRAARS